MTITVDYLKKNEIPKQDWDIYLKADNEPVESTEGVDQHWLDKADEGQSHDYILTQGGNIWKEKYLAGLKCYQVKIDIGRGNFERWKQESPVSPSTIESWMRYAKNIIWKAGIVKQGKEPRRKQIIRGVKFLRSNPLRIKDLCMEIEQEKKAADSPQQKKMVDEIPSQDELDRVGQHYLRLVDKRMKHFIKMSSEEKNKFEESLMHVRDGADERIDHFKILSVRPKVKLEDLQLEV